MTSLFDVVKKHLRITHDHLDDEIDSLIEEGKVYINAICGETNFDKSGLGVMLLKNYCRFAHSNVPELFMRSFQSELILLQIENGVKRNESES